MSIPALRKAENGKFYVYWSEGKRSKRQSLLTKDADKAKSRFAVWLTHRDVDQDVGTEHTVEVLWNTYFTRHVEINAASPTPFTSVWKNLKPAFGALAPSDLTDDKVDKYVRDRRAGRIGRPSKGTTIRHELTLLTSCFNWCAHPKRKLITKAEIPVFDMPDADEPRDRWLRRDEIEKLLAVAAARRTGNRLSRLERFLWIALETASRKTAIYELTWDRVDFDIGVIEFNVPGRKKTKKRRVPVPISKRLAPILRQMHEERENEFVLDHGNDLWNELQLAVVAAELGTRTKKKGATGITLHTLRHTAATLMAREGVPLYTIAGVLGNSLAMVEKVYAKHCLDALRQAVDTISGD